MKEAEHILIINPGPLSTFNSVSAFVANDFQKIRMFHARGIIPKIGWRLSTVQQGTVRIAGITAFISIARFLRRYSGQRMPISMEWNAKLLGFLHDIGLFDLDKKYDLFDWGGTDGGYIAGFTNPDTKIIDYIDVPDFLDPRDFIAIEAWKKDKREDIKRNLKVRTEGIFYSPYQNDRNVQYLKSLMESNTAELIANSLLHAREVCFVGLQRTRYRITIAVSDTGKGFPRTLLNNYPILSDRLKTDDHLMGILIASFIKLEKLGEIGLYRTINEIIEVGGWVVINSYNAEIRWERELWNKVKNWFLFGRLEKTLPDLSILGEIETKSVDKTKILKGYAKKFPSSIPGTRITFEIPINV